MTLIEQKVLQDTYKQAASGYAPTLERIHDAEQHYSGNTSCCLEVWRSSRFLAVVYRDNRSGGTRISVNRTTIKLNGDWEEDITWSELMQVKREIGRGEQHAVEIYPADSCIVDVANMRHLWLLDEPHPYTWKEATQP